MKYTGDCSGRFFEKRLREMGFESTGENYRQGPWTHTQVNRVLNPIKAGGGLHRNEILRQAKALLQEGEGK